MTPSLTKVEASEPMQSPNDGRLAQILEGCLYDLEQGLVPDVEELARKHPELADELRGCLEGLQMVHVTSRRFRDVYEDDKHEDGELPAPAEPQCLGDFQLIRVIGRGGMGIVYEAHQQSLNRRVALKILPFAAVLDQRQIARFRNEAQAAAQLHHPNIVPVFAVGQQRGVYYYAMQYVEGQSLDEMIRERKTSGHSSDKLTDEHWQRAFCEASTVRLCGTFARSTHVSIRDREYFQTVARLGAQAAEALNHAHELGIVHRDVKPSNLLLDLHGKIWVTDFGLARIQTQAGMTASGNVVGTLRYMSPEQASGRAALVDARTDVYSLGATLYEMLTLEPALAGEDRQTLLRQLEQQHVSPLRNYNPAVPADLETIILQAMAPVPHERYATAQELADDLNRFLAGKPTRARRPSLLDRLGRWTVRHRAMVALAAASVVLISVLSTVGMVLLVREQARTARALHRANEQTEIAKQNLARAEDHFRQARDAVDRFGIQTAERLRGLPGAEQLRHKLLDETRNYFRQFLAQAGDDPALRDDLALAHFKSAVLTAELGDVTGAIEEYRIAQRLLKLSAANRNRGRDVLSRLALAHNNVALLLAEQGDLEQANREHQSAMSIASEMIAGQSQAPELVRQVSEIRANYGMFLYRLGARQKAVDALSVAIGQLQPLVDSEHADAQNARDLAICYNNLSYIQRTDDIAAAEQSSRQAVTILERFIADAAAGDRLHSDLALCYNNLAAVLGQADRVDAAIRCYQQGVEIQQRLARKAPAMVRHRSELAVTLNNLGVACCRMERSDEADKAFANARDILGTLAEDYPAELSFKLGLGGLLNNQGLALAEAGRLQQACQVYAEAIEILRPPQDDVPLSTQRANLLKKVHVNFSQSLIKSSGPLRAAALARQGCNLVRSAKP